MENNLYNILLASTDQEALQKWALTPGKDFALMSLRPYDAMPTTVKHYFDFRDMPSRVMTSQ